MKRISWTDTREREQVVSGMLLRMQAKGLLNLHQHSDGSQSIEITPKGKARRLFAVNQ